MVWIDDDLRMFFHSPVQWGCFCDRCLARFANKTQTPRDRETLWHALREPDNGRLRAAWMAFNTERLAELARVVRDAVLAVSPKTIFGLQQSFSLYDGRTLGPVYDVLDEEGRRLVGARPGGGLYTDYMPRDILAKAFDLAVQFANLPPCVTIRIPEIENFIHASIGKTPRGTALEAAVDAAIGCNGLSLANLMLANETVPFHATTFAKLEAWKPYISAIMHQCVDAPLAGMEVVYPERYHERPLLPDESPDAWPFINLAPCFTPAGYGLALCADRRAARGAILGPDAAKGVTKEELQSLIRRGLLMDGGAADICARRGFAKLIGATVRPLPHYNSPEYFTDDPLNGTDLTTAFYMNPFDVGSGQFAVQPLAGSNCRILCTFRAADGSDEGITTAAIETPLGRIGIIGRHAWNNCVSTRRRDQVLNLADWVCGHASYVRILPACHVTPLVRAEPDGTVRAITLLNQGFDDTPPLQLLVRLSAKQAGAFASMQPEQPLAPLEPTTVKELPGEAPSGLRVYLLDLPPIPRWSIRTIFCS